MNVIHTMINRFAVMLKNCFPSSGIISEKIFFISWFPLNNKQLTAK